MEEENGYDRSCSLASSETNGFQDQYGPLMAARKQANAVWNRIMGIQKKKAPTAEEKRMVCAMSPSVLQRKNERIMDLRIANPSLLFPKGIRQRLDSHLYLSKGPECTRVFAVRDRSAWRAASCDDCGDWKPFTR